MAFKQNYCGFELGEQLRISFAQLAFCDDRNANISGRYVSALNNFCNSNGQYSDLDPSDLFIMAGGPGSEASALRMNLVVRRGIVEGIASILSNEVFSITPVSGVSRSVVTQDNLGLGWLAESSRPSINARLDTARKIGPYLPIIFTITTMASMQRAYVPVLDEQFRLTHNFEFVD